MTSLPAPVGMMPVASPRIFFLLYSILLCTIADLSLSLINLSLTSFFLGLITTISTIIHILTNLSIIYYRQHRQRRGRSHTSQKPISPIGLDWNLLPPTSKLSSITMDLLLAVLFIISSVTTLLLHFMHYFDGGPNANIGADGNWFGQSTNPLKGPKAVIYADAAMEVLCGILLIALGAVGIFDRRKFREMAREITSVPS